MAKIRLNGYTREFQGRVGPHVFRRRRDGTMVASIRPDTSHLTPTAAQLAVRRDFITAASYAKRVLGNPLTRAPYDVLAAAGHLTPFALAVRDWYHLPTVDDISLARYHGNAGDFIDIVASDDVGLTAVLVTIKHRTTQAVLEAGNATGNGEAWIYTATTTLPTGEPVTIEVTAKDGTEHEGKDTRNYP